MNAILGPTGGGKTSLLDVLAARKNPEGLSGTVLVNGKEQPRNFRLASGYVVQDDVIMGTLTVRENLEFSASLRLPMSVSKEEKSKRVNDIIEELGLTKCAETKIGTQFIRGVSGGERKRTNIGMELVTQPGVLFLDEPTTGLDATTAYAVIQHLARYFSIDISPGYHKKGRTIIFSIHQPRFTIFRQINRLHLLSLGETVYHGPADSALEYFSNIGYVCEEHNNPADFFLDTIILNQLAVTGGGKTKALDTVENGSFSRATELLTEVYKKSEAKRDLEIEAKKIMGVSSSGRRNRHADTQEISYATSFFQQLTAVSARAAKNIIRNPFVMVVQNVILLIFALLSGLIYFQLDNSRPEGIQNSHESANGFYRVSPYYFGKIICDLLPLRLFPTLIFTTITYWMIGLKPEATAYFIFVFTLVLTSFVTTGVAFAVSSSFKDLGVATIMSAMVFVLSMIFGGVLVNISSLPEWIQWIQYLSLFRYTINALSINEFVGQTFCDENNLFCIPGEAFLDSQGINYTTWGLWQNHAALAVIIVFFFTLAYIQLRRVPRYK
ncbi:ATP-binding cassette transporter subfamily G member 2a [Apostichopus japonicus]|uniref:ATP-binding cassette transporter subfamily G member 2a n=1 Tax=Stichopus japonicus TaxID=307972 RepID=A0A2G8KS10_STIJA|nr:ATP-binding cassette transporter subfamily G member 2a [Apostichopus japonicus]